MGKRLCLAPNYTLLLATVSLALRYKIKIGFSYCGKGWVKVENKDLAKMLSKDPKYAFGNIIVH